MEEQLEPNQEVEFYVCGGAAILLAYDGELATVDVNFIGPKFGRLLELSQMMGRGSEIHHHFSSGHDGGSRSPGAAHGQLLSPQREDSFLRRLCVLLPLRGARFRTGIRTVCLDCHMRR